MESSEPPAANRSRIGWLVLVAVLLIDAGLVVWLLPRHNEEHKYDATGLNLTEPPVPDTAPEARIQPPAVRPAPVGAPEKISSRKPNASWIQPAKQQGFPARVQERTEWTRAVYSFTRLAQSSKYRRSSVLRSWARDFLAYPDLRTIARIYARNHDLNFFTVYVLRSTNFAKMLRKYGSSPDVSSFFKDLMSSPGVPDSSRALFDDPNVRNSIKDLTIPGLPSLGQMMSGGSQGVKPQVNDADARKLIKDIQRQAGSGAQ